MQLPQENHGFPFDALTVCYCSPPIRSFTVVWQDQVGGLQTYCHACQKWMDVGTVATTAQQQQQQHDGTSWDFVVHVGDFTSICVGRALEEEAAATQDKTKEEHDLSSCVVWPSPKHRVVSPTQQRRLSLVYFAYPPAAASLQSMQEKLSRWCRSNLAWTSKSIRVPWEDYYVLQNQSSQGKRDVRPSEMYKKIASLPVKDVLLEKWNQVQR